MLAPIALYPDPLLAQLLPAARVFFAGIAPSIGPGVFDRAANNLTVYYLPRATGWGPAFADRPAVLWNPQIQTGDRSFGVRADGFGFNIAGTPDIPLVVEA